MITTLNLVLFIGLAIAVILSVQYLFKIRDRHYKLKVSEIKAQSIQKKLDKEKQEINEIKKRLEEQKGPLDKKWDEIQAGYRMLDEKALNLQQEREMLDARKLDIDQQQADIELQIKKIETLTQSFQLKWEQQRQQDEEQRNELIKFRSQIVQGKDDVAAAKNQLIAERQSFEQEKRKLVKRSNEAELLKIHYEQEKHNLLKQKTNIQEEEKKLTQAKNQLEHEKLELGKLKQDILIQQQDLLKQKQQLDDHEKSLQAKVEWINQESEKIQQSELEIKNALRQLTTRMLRKIKEDKQQQSNQKLNQASLAATASCSDDSFAESVHDDNKHGRFVFEVVCWKRTHDWRIGIGILGKIPQVSNVQIFQDGVELPTAELRDPCWQLSSLSPCSIKWNENGKIREQNFSFVAENFDKPLLFKLKKFAHVIGKLVSYPSHGTYLAIVPDSWQRAENISSAASFPPENCSIAGFRCHFFKLKNNHSTLIAFRKADGRSMAIAPQGSRFQLAGDRLDHAEIKNSSCFVNRLPIVHDKNESWSNIGLIVIGEEGEAMPHKIWKIKPDVIDDSLDLQLLEQKGSIHLLESRHCHFFINIYDLNDHLLESITFSYLEGLKKIEIAPYPLLPESAGHQPVKVKFIHDKRCKIDQIANQDELILNHEAEGTSVEILPSPVTDTTDWLITDSVGRQVKATIQLQRLWWALLTNNEKPLKKYASDRSIQLNLDQLRFIQKYGIYIWLPANHQLSKSFVGFERSQAKILLLQPDESKLFIRLAEFINQDNLPHISSNRQMKFWLDIEKDKSVALIDFISHSFRCRLNQCDFKANDVGEMIVHIKNEHFFDLVNELSYQQIRLNYNPDLPEEIYQCGYCKDFIDVAKYTTHPTTAIIDHIKQCSAAITTNGNPFISFRIVTDIHEIRKLVDLPIPVVYECFICKKHFVNQSEDAICRHFFDAHQNELMAETSASPKQISEHNEIAI